MAAGDILAVFGPLQNLPPASNYAFYNMENNIPCLSFDASTSYSAVFSDVLPANYAGGGITVTLVWNDSQNTGNVVWAVSFERDNSGASLASDNFGTEQSLTVAAPGTALNLAYSDVAFTNSQISSLGTGEMYRLKVRRDAANGSDTNTGSSFIFKVILKEA